MIAEKLENFSFKTCLLEPLRQLIQVLSPPCKLDVQMNR